MLMSLNKGETAVHDCHCPGDMTVRMREVLARPWVGVCVPHALSLSSLYTLQVYFALKGLVVTRIYMYYCLMKVPFVRSCSIVPYPIHKIIPYTLKMQSGSNKHDNV